jgi:hypothetical protein
MKKLYNRSAILVSLALILGAGIFARGHPLLIHATKAAGGQP